MQTSHAIYENGLFRPTDTVELPDPCEVELNIQSRRPTAIRQTTLARLAEIGRSFPANPAIPEDLPAQHDHYLYGLPKQP
jgi:predicted DNA-binding antitoxin AbrB/MazE fold protein